METAKVINRFNLNLVNLIIEDSEPTLAYEVDPNDEVFNLKITN